MKTSQLLGELYQIHQANSKTATIGIAHGSTLIYRNRDYELPLGTVEEVPGSDLLFNPLLPDTSLSSERITKGCRDIGEVVRYILWELDSVSAKYIRRQELVDFIESKEWNPETVTASDLEFILFRMECGEDWDRFCSVIQRPTTWLTRLNLGRLSLFYADLVGINLEGADLRKADFRCINFRGANFQRANLSGLAMGSHSLIDCDFSKATFRGEQGNTSFVRANARGSNFGATDLSGLDFSGATLDEASIRMASLDGANFERASLVGVELNNSSCRKTRFYETDLKGVDFSGADLSEACFVRADLSGSQFIRANLSGAYFYDCNIKEVDFLVDSNLSDAIIEEEELK